MRETFVLAFGTKRPLINNASRKVNPFHLQQRPPDHVI